MRRTWTAGVGLALCVLALAAPAAAKPKQPYTAEVAQKLMDLAASYDSADPVVRKHAVSESRWIAWRYEVPESNILPLLSRALADIEPWVRAEAAVGIGKAGLTSPAAVDAVIVGLKDSDRRVTWAAAISAEYMGPAAKAAVPALVDLLAGTDASTRRAAAVALATIGPTDNATVGPALAAATANGGPHTRWAAVWAIGELGLNEPATLDAIISALDDKDDDIRAAAANARTKIRLTDRFGAEMKAAAAAQVLQKLTQLLRDREEHVRWAAIWALGEAGPAAVNTTPELMAIYRDPQAPSKLRTAAVNALGKIGLAHPAIDDTLQQARDDQDPNVRAIATERLQDLGLIDTPPDEQ